jgi:hypothetical protein
MQSLKHAEQLVDVLHVEAHAVVANEVARLFLVLFRADDDDRFLAPPRVLQSIV